MKRGVMVSLAAGALIVVGILYQPAQVSLRLGSPMISEVRAEERGVLYYRHPMNPRITSPVPARDEMGMDYIPVHAGETGEEGVVWISPAMTQNMNVRLGHVRRETLVRRIETFGSVAYDEERISHVHVRVPGWIERLAVRTTGASVERGQLLFEFYAPELASAQEEFLQAMRSGLERAVDAARERLHALGLSRGQIEELERTRQVQPRVGIHARQDGIVNSLNVREGMHVTPDLEAMSLVDLSTVWIIAEVLVRQSGGLAGGERAEVRLPFPSDARLEGVVDYIYPELNPKTRTVPVRLRIDNPGGLLKPGMYVSADIAAAPRTDALTVPRDAVIRTGREERVIVHLGEGRFQARPVRTGVMGGERVEILDGLEEGEQIVLSGQFLIDSEAAAAAAFRRMEPAEDVAGTPDRDVIRSEGRIGRVDSAERRVNVTHPPIPRLGWPGMTMDFRVARDVDLDALSVGDRVRFEILPDADEDGMYVITAIAPAGGE